MSEFKQETPRDCPQVATPQIPYIIIKSELIEEQRGIGSKSGKPYCIRKQVAHIYNSGLEEFPEKFIIQLRDDDRPYPKGWYTFLPQAFGMADFGELRIFPNLQRIAAPIKPNSSGN